MTLTPSGATLGWLLRVAPEGGSWGWVGPEGGSWGWVGPEGGFWGWVGPEGGSWGWVGPEGGSWVWLLRVGGSWGWLLRVAPQGGSSGPLAVTFLIWQVSYYHTLSGTSCQPWLIFNELKLLNIYDQLETKLHTNP